MRTLKRWRAAIGVGLLMFLAAGTARVFGQSPEIVSLAQAVHEALERNERLLNEHDNIEQANLGIRLARNNFQPKVVPNVLGSFGQTDVTNQTYRLDVSQRFTTGTELRAGVGTSSAQIPTSLGQGDIRFYNTDTTIALSQPLLRGFGTTVGRRPLTSAELRQADAARQQTLSEQQVTIEVAAAYYRLVAQKALVEVAKKSLDRSRQLRDASEAKLDAGLVSQLDVFRAQQLVSHSQIQLFDAEAAIEDARDQLGFLMGRDGDASFDVAGDIPKFVEPVVADELVAVALAGRLDLQRATAAAADADLATSYARNQLLPQVDVNLALTRRETADSFASSFRFDRFQLATFFTIAMPVDRTPQQIAYQNALIDRDRRRRDIDTLRRRVTSEVKRAVRDRDRLLRTLVAAEASVEIGQKEVEVAQFRYERGLSNNLDVVAAETNLLSAESQRISALAESALARLNLRAIVGVLNPRQDLAEPAAPEDGAKPTR